MIGLLVLFCGFFFLNVVYPEVAYALNTADFANGY